MTISESTNTFSYSSIRENILLVRNENVLADMHLAFIHEKTNNLIELLRQLLLINFLFTRRSGFKSFILP